MVEVLHAQRGSQVEHIPLAALMDRCDGYFTGEGRLIDQPFQAAAAGRDDPLLPGPGSRWSGSAGN